MLNFNENINLIVKNYKGTESIKNGNLFKISGLYYTSGIENLISDVNSVNSLSKNINKFIHGNWGEICKEDIIENEEGVKEGNMLLGSYKINDKKIWIIADSTNIPQERKITVLLPSEY